MFSVSSDRAKPYLVVRMHLAEIKTRCEQFGITVAGLVSARGLRARLEEERRHLQDWQSSGYAGEMGYMARDTEMFVEVERFLPECRSVLCLAIPYSRSSSPYSKAHTVQPGIGRVARYAWGRDYHLVIRDVLETLISDLQTHCFDRKVKFRIFTDAVPILERAMAIRAKLGFIGKNTLSILSGLGSYHFLAEILWDVEIEDEPEPAFLPRVPEVRSANVWANCGDCTRCITQCPTNAIVRPGFLDARRCISYLTIEKKTAFDEFESSAIGNWIFGCDICQEVCPFNHRNISQSLWDQFSPLQGVGPELDLLEVLKIRANGDFRARFGETALMRAGRAGLIRNACAIVGNTFFDEAEDQLLDLIQTDTLPLIRESAAAAHFQLRQPRGLRSDGVTAVLKPTAGKVLVQGAQFTSEP